MGIKDNKIPKLFKGGKKRDKEKKVKVKKSKKSDSSKKGMSVLNVRVKLLASYVILFAT